MLTLANLTARCCLDLVTDLVSRGKSEPHYAGRRYRHGYGMRGQVEGADWYSADRRLVVWVQLFPGADLDVHSDVEAPLINHYR